jgi:hypothetical protein
MRPHRFLLPLLPLAVLGGARDAAAFGGSAAKLPEQGNFAVTNSASFGFSHPFTSNGGTSIALQPALEYFVVQGLSLGGALVFAHDDPGGGDPSTTSIGVEPTIGYDLSLGDTWSFWPHATVSIISTSSSQGGHSSTASALSLFAPFLVHPAEHFFFGIGPGLSFDLSGNNKTTTLFGAFLIGGYFGG